jgi:hypothetical protein
VGGGVAPDVCVIALLAGKKLANTRGAVHCLGNNTVFGREALFTLVSLISEKL